MGVYNWCLVNFSYDIFNKNYVVVFEKMKKEKELNMESEMDDVADYLVWINNNIIKPKTRFRLKRWQIERKENNKSLC